MTEYVHQRLLFKQLFISLIFGLLALEANAQTIQGLVTSVADGDTLTLLTPSNEQVKIRLAGIDAPEKAQPFGNRSKQALASLVFQKQVSVDVQTIDRYGRSIGRIYVQGVDVSAEQVIQGMAWVYRKYTDDQLLYKYENKAKKAKRGLWLDDSSIEPWLWRRGKRTIDGSEPMNGDIIGNKSSKIYHLNNCPSYFAVSEKNRVIFKNETLAVQSGYRKAGNCP